MASTNCSGEDSPYLFNATDVNAESNTDPYGWTFTMMLCVFGSVVFTYSHVLQTFMAFFYDYSFIVPANEAPKGWKANYTWSNVLEEIACLGFVVSLAGITMNNYYDILDKTLQGSVIHMTGQLLIWLTFAWIAAHKLITLGVLIDRANRRTLDFNKLGNSSYIARGPFAHVPFFVRQFDICFNWLLWYGLPLIVAITGAALNGDLSMDYKGAILAIVIPSYVIGTIVYFLSKRRQGWFGEIFDNTCITAEAFGQTSYGYSVVSGSTNLDLNKIRIGHSADILGDGTFVRGEIPVQFITTNQIIMRVLLMTSALSLIYSDPTQLMAAIACVEILPLFMTAFAKNNQYFIAYEMTSIYWFYIWSYFWSFGDAKCVVNQQLITLAGNTAAPTMQLLLILVASITIGTLQLLLPNSELRDGNTLLITFTDKGSTIVDDSEKYDTADKTDEDRQQKLSKIPERTPLRRRPLDDTLASG